MTRRIPKQRAAVGVLGKALTRRSGGRCEVCSSREQPMAWEIPPFPHEPDLERSLMACARCRVLAEQGRTDDDEIRFLEHAVWSSVPAVRLFAGRVLLQTADPGLPWAREAIEHAGVDPLTGELLPPYEDAAAAD